MKERLLPYMYCDPCKHSFRYNGRLKTKLSRLGVAFRKLFKKNDKIFECPNCNSKANVEIKHVLTTWEYP